MVGRVDLGIDELGPLADEPTGRGLPAGATNDGTRIGVDGGMDVSTRPERAVTNQHSFAEDDFEVDTARNYHGVDDPA